MKVLVTGASGFVGRHLVPALAERDHEVTALVRRSGAAPAGATSTVQADLEQPLPEGALPRVDAVVHLAQGNGRFPEGARGLFRVNTAATQELLDHARRAGAACFLYASSASVYGFGSRPFREDDVVSPPDFYALTKAVGEQLVSAYRGFVAATSLRLVAPYGPGQSGRMIPRLIESVREGRPVTLNEGGRPAMNPIYVGDVVEAVLALLDSPASGVLNLAGDQVVSIRELAESIGAGLGLEPVFEHGSDAAPGDVVAENLRLRELLGERELVPLREGLRRTGAATS